MRYLPCSRRTYSGNVGGVCINMGVSVLSRVCIVKTNCRLDIGCNQLQRHRDQLQRHRGVWLFNCSILHWVESWDNYCNHDYCQYTGHWV